MMTMQKMLRRMPRPTVQIIQAQKLSKFCNQPPVAQLSTGAPEVSNTKKNRSLEGNNETKQAAATDDKDASTDHTEDLESDPEEDPTTSVTTAKMKIKRNDEEECVPTKEATNSSLTKCRPSTWLAHFATLAKLQELPASANAACSFDRESSRDRHTLVTKL
jgi:hypothetical protein